jgi:hypothetical protein
MDFAVRASEVGCYKFAIGILDCLETQNGIDEHKRAKAFALPVLDTYWNKDFKKVALVRIKDRTKLHESIKPHPELKGIQPRKEIHPEPLSNAQPRIPLITVAPEAIISVEPEILPTISISLYQEFDHDHEDEPEEEDWSPVTKALITNPKEISVIEQPASTKPRRKSAIGLSAARQISNILGDSFNSTVPDETKVKVGKIPTVKSSSVIEIVKPLEKLNDDSSSKFLNPNIPEEEKKEHTTHLRKLSYVEQALHEVVKQKLKGDEVVGNIISEILNTTEETTGLHFGIETLLGFDLDTHQISKPKGPIIKPKKNRTIPSAQKLNAKPISTTLVPRGMFSSQNMFGKNSSSLRKRLYGNRTDSLTEPLYKCFDYRSPNASNQSSR